MSPESQVQALSKVFPSYPPLQLQDALSTAVAMCYRALLVYEPEYLVREVGIPSDTVQLARTLLPQDAERFRVRVERIRATQNRAVMRAFAHSLQLGLDASLRTASGVSADVCDLALLIIGEALAKL